MNPATVAAFHALAHRTGRADPPNSARRMSPVGHSLHKRDVRATSDSESYPCGPGAPNESGESLRALRGLSGNSPMTGFVGLPHALIGPPSSLWRFCWTLESH